MTEPDSPVTRNGVLPWVLLTIVGGCLAVAVAVIALVTRQDPAEAAKKDAIDPCDFALADGYPEVTEAGIIEKSVFSSADWQDYQRTIGAYGVELAVEVDMMAPEQVAEIDTTWADRRAEGEEKVWIVWEIEGDLLIVCIADFLDGDLIKWGTVSGPST